MLPIARWVSRGYGVDVVGMNIQGCELLLAAGSNVEFMSLLDRIGCIRASIGERDDIGSCGFDGLREAALRIGRGLGRSGRGIEDGHERLLMADGRWTRVSRRWTARLRPR